MLPEQDNANNAGGGGDTPAATVTTEPTSTPSTGTQIGGAAIHQSFTESGTQNKQSRTDIPAQAGAGQYKRNPMYDLGEDVVYLTTEADAQHGVEASQVCAGKIVKVIRDGENTTYNLHVYAHDSTAIILVTGASQGHEPGQFQFN